MRVSGGQDLWFNKQVACMPRRRVVTQNRIYTLHRAWLVALDLHSGKEQWRQRLPPRWGRNHDLVGTRNLLLASGGNGHLWAFDPRTQRRLWQYKIKARYYDSWQVVPTRWGLAAKFYRFQSESFRPLAFQLVRDFFIGRFSQEFIAFLDGKI